MLATVAQQANSVTEATVPAWLAWSAIVANVIVIVGSLAALGRWLRKVVTNLVHETIAPVSKKANEAYDLAAANQDEVKRAHNRIDDVFHHLIGASNA